MTTKELAIKLIISNQKIVNLTNQLLELRRYEAETEFLLLAAIETNDQVENMLQVELVCDAAYLHTKENVVQSPVKRLNSVSRINTKKRALKQRTNDPTKEFKGLNR